MTKREAEELLELGLWRPINTAPKDGRTILIWYAAEPIHAAYLAEHHGRIPQWYLLDKWRNWGPVSQPPQYWMPLPQFGKVDERTEALVRCLKQAMWRLEVTTCEWKEAIGDSSENSTPGDVLEKNEALLAEWNKPEPAKGEEPKP